MVFMCLGSYSLEKHDIPWSACCNSFERFFVALLSKLRELSDWFLSFLANLSKKQN